MLDGGSQLFFTFHVLVAPDIPWCAEHPISKQSHKVETARNLKGSVTSVQKGHLSHPSPGIVTKQEHPDHQHPEQNLTAPLFSDKQT